MYVASFNPNMITYNVAIYGIILMPLIYRIGRMNLAPSCMSVNATHIVIPFLQVNNVHSYIHI